MPQLNCFEVAIVPGREHWEEYRGLRSGHGLFNAGERTFPEYVFESKANKAPNHPKLVRWLQIELGKCYQFDLTLHPGFAYSNHDYKHKGRQEECKLVILEICRLVNGNRTLIEHVVADRETYEAENQVGAHSWASTLGYRTRKTSNGTRRYHFRMPKIRAGKGVKSRFGDITIKVFPYHASDKEEARSSATLQVSPLDHDDTPAVSREIRGELDADHYEGTIVGRCLAEFVFKLVTKDFVQVNNLRPATEVHVGASEEKTEDLERRQDVEDTLSIEGGLLEQGFERTKLSLGAQNQVTHADPRSQDERELPVGPSHAVSPEMPSAQQNEDLNDVTHRGARHVPIPLPAEETIPEDELKEKDRQQPPVNKPQDQTRVRSELFESVQKLRNTLWKDYHNEALHTKHNQYLESLKMVKTELDAIIDDYDHVRRDSAYKTRRRSIQGALLSLENGMLSDKLTGLWRGTEAESCSQLMRSVKQEIERLVDDMGPSSSTKHEAMVIDSD